MQIKPSDTIRRTYEKISPNFPTELEHKLHDIIKTSSITEIVAEAETSLYQDLANHVIDRKALRAALRTPSFEYKLEIAFTLGGYVYSRFGKDMLKRHFMTNDITVLPNGNGWKFIMRSLSRQKINSNSSLYYSSKAPKLDLWGNKCQIAYTDHCIERLHERSKRGKLTYGALGDTFSFLYENSYFEVVDLTDGSKAVSIFAMCGDEGNAPFDIVKAIYGNNYCEEDKYYYRIGYLPIEPYKEFALARTLLCPGYLKTPEYKLLSESEENAEWLKRAMENERKDSLSTYDLRLILKMHGMGIPQVKVLEGKVYHF